MLRNRDTSATLGVVEAAILRAVAVISEPYGVSIQDYIAVTTGRNISLGQIYTSLERMKTKGLVTSSLTNPEPVRGGRSKRVYAPTDRGIQALEQFAATFAMIADVKEVDRGTTEPKPAVG